MHLRPKSLQSYLTLVVVATLLLSLVGVSAFLAIDLRGDIKAQLAQSQQARADDVAANLAREVQKRLSALRKLAPKLFEATQDNNIVLARLLRAEVVTAELFNAGMAVVVRDAGTLAQTPVNAPWLSTMPLTSTQLTQALLGQNVVGLSGSSDGSGRHTVMAVPIQFGDTIAGVLVGVLRTDMPNALDELLQAPPGVDLTLLDGQARIVLMANEHSLLKQALPALGAVPRMDGFLAGARGTTEFVSNEGKSCLAAHAPVANTPWVVAWSTVTDTAYGPAQALVRRLLTTGLFGSLAAGFLTWLMLRRALRPVVASLDDLAQRSQDSRLFESPLPAPPQQDELGRLVVGFNSLLARLGASRARARLLFDQSPLAAIEWDTALCVLRWNPAAEAMFGYTAAQAQGLHAQFLIPVDQADLVRPMIDKLRAGQAARGEAVNRRQDGRRIVCRWYNTPLRNAQGQVLGYASFVRDVTEQRSAEQELRIAALVFESPQGVAIFDAQRQVIRVNRAFTSILGYTEQEAMGQTPDLVRSGHHDEAFYTNLWDMVHKVGAWSGEVYNRRKNGEEFAEWLNLSAVRDNKGNVTHYVSVFSDLSERYTTQANIQHMASHDALTGLFNRTGLIGALANAIEAAQKGLETAILLLIDVDDFSAMNDTQGHAVGDHILQVMAQRLSQLLPDTAVLARVSADVFAVLMPTVDDLGNGPAQSHAADLLARRMRAACLEPLMTNATELRISVCIGMTLLDRPDNVQVDNLTTEMFEHAELALRHAKQAGRNEQRLFEPSMRQSLQARSALEIALRAGVAQKQFVLFYQAQVNAQGHCVGAEALVRWQHPTKGLISPLEFIPLAEETGDILMLGQQVLDLACAQLSQWAHHPFLHHLHLSVNVSARQLQQDDFVSQLRDTLARHGVPAGSLRLELTESMLARNLDDTLIKMHGIKALGVSLALDDFGTGYSSLTYLKRLPIDELKIDQSFVRYISTDPADAAISRVVLALGANLQLEVVAEGVETAEHRDALAAMGCKVFQGYYYSRPVPVEEFVQFVEHVKPENFCVSVPGSLQ